MSIADRIMDYLEDLKESDTVLGIAKNLGIKKNVARARLSELTRAGKIRRIGTGLYECESTHRVISETPRIHDFLAVAKVDFDVVHYDWHWDCVQEGPNGIDVFRIDLCLGQSRSQITWRVTSPRGMDYLEIKLVEEIIRRVLSSRGYKYPDEWKVNCHLNNDIVGLRLDGVEVVTGYSLDKTLERIYNKGSGIRREVAPSRRIGIQELYALINGGVQNYDLVRRVTMLEKSHQDLVNATKYLNSNVGRCVKYLQDIIKKFVRDAEREDRGLP